MKILFIILWRLIWHGGAGMTAIVPVEEVPDDRP